MTTAVQCRFVGLWPVYGKLKNMKGCSFYSPSNCGKLVTRHTAANGAALSITAHKEGMTPQAKWRMALQRGPLAVDGGPTMINDLQKREGSEFSKYPGGRKKY